MIQIEVEDVTEVFKKAKESQTDPYASILYERFQKTDAKGKPADELFVGNIIVSAIGKVLGEVTIFFYKEEIANSEKTKKEVIQEKCRKEIDEMIDIFAKQDIHIKKGAISK